MLDIRIKAYGAAAAVFALDRLTKRTIETRVSVADTYRVIPGFFDNVNSQNRGVVFGIFNDSTSAWRTPLLVLISIAAVIAVGAVLWKLGSQRLDRLSLWGFALILGGAAGNVFDRIVAGRVTDFLDFYVGQYHWPAFNVADSAIDIGIGLSLLSMLRARRQAPHVS